MENFHPACLAITIAIPQMGLRLAGIGLRPAGFDFVVQCSSSSARLDSAHCSADGWSPGWRLNHPGRLSHLYRIGTSGLQSLPLQNMCDNLLAVMPELFTIGHSTHSWEKFLELLRQHRIEAVADVRSSPCSQYNPQFNREPLQSALREQGVAYVFLGEELGARRSEPECYVNGRVDYSLVARTPAFIRGLDWIIQGAAKKRIAMMCAEKDPLDCHRCILVSPQLQKRGINVLHIHSDGSLENQGQAERRLARMLNISEGELFRSADELVAEAYRVQGEKIAYQKPAPGQRDRRDGGIDAHKASEHTRPDPNKIMGQLSGQ